METSLHRQLKTRYAGDDDQVEVRVGRYRIDAVAGKWLVEIQHGSLAAIRDKIRRLLQQHRVLVVKPIIASKLLVKRKRKGGPIVDRRKSPKQGTPLDLFDEMVYFTRVFPHPNLALEIALVDVEEWRYPGHGRRRRRRERDFVVEDQHLVEVHRTIRLKTAADLWRLMPSLRLPKQFHTGQLAEQLEAQRWVAQRIAYVLREVGAVRQTGKQGNALLYTRKSRKRRAAA